MHARLTLLAAGGVILLLKFIRKDLRQQVPFTGRKHAVLVPEAIERALGETTFARLLASKRRLPDPSPESQRCARLGAAIIRAALAGDGKGGFVDHLRDIAWKVVVVDDDQINACALPGGKIVINSGLVRRFAEDEGALAFVIAHEVGHVLARHSAEQLTLQGATQLVATIAQGAVLAAAAAASSGQPGVQMPRGEIFFSLLLFPFSLRSWFFFFSRCVSRTSFWFLEGSRFPDSLSHSRSPFALSTSRAGKKKKKRFFFFIRPNQGRGRGPGLLTRDGPVSPALPRARIRG